MKLSGGGALGRDGNGEIKVLAKTLSPVIFRLWGGRVEADLGGGQLKFSAQSSKFLHVTWT